MKFRPDINGLRAIAVLLVVFYHVHFPVPGGFVGVDVFFVISGFLITSIIEKEIRTGVFSFGNFYSRRAKRLLPAFIFMLIPLFIYCWYNLLAVDLVSFSKSALFSIIGASNFYFYSIPNYIILSGREPLIHTWSLSIEEQFYLIWPVMLFLLYKKKDLRINFVILSVVLFLSLFSAQYCVIHDKHLAYMMLPFRFFELLSGAVLAINYRRIKVKDEWIHVTSVLGFFLILSSAFLINKNSQFPGFLSLPVVIGATLFIVSYNGNKFGIFNRILSNSIISYIGKVSYSFYLWHWPIIMFSRYRGIELNKINSSVIIVISFSVACLSYHFVEKPFRRLNYRKYTLPFFYLLSVLLLMVISIVITKNN
ncbi:acyltransferase family protein [Xenorhabdus griffiniae]|uniref:acyltransferase family protein n=1 Tax=Xenorhabdus griffiniae TaxID=351672 RepID=UPI00235992FE|nr:acyltransferase [Xenorhabdus griffiniae]MDC9605893.1 acyltransferase [Xenorhabdus griffiniae]